MTREVAGWLVVDEPPARPLATARGRAWLWVETSTQGTDVVLHMCAGQDRANVPVEVVEALLAAHAGRSVP